MSEFGDLAVARGSAPAFCRVVIGKWLDSELTAEHTLNFLLWAGTNVVLLFIRERLIPVLLVTVAYLIELPNELADERVQLLSRLVTGYSGLYRFNDLRLSELVTLLKVHHEALEAEPRLRPWLVRFFVSTDDFSRFSQQFRDYVGESGEPNPAVTSW